MPGRPIFWMIGQGPVALAAGAGGVVCVLYLAGSFLKRPTP